MDENLEFILNALGVKVYNIKNNEISTFCLNPLHDDKNLGNFSINILSGKFHCFSCGFSGNIISLLYDKGVSYSKAIGLWNYLRLDHTEKIETYQKIDKYVINSFIQNGLSEYAVNRVKSVDVLLKYGVLSDKKGNPIFTTRNCSGEYTSLWVRENNKYFLIEPLNAKSRLGVFFGEHLPPTDYTILVEGTFDAMKAYIATGYKSVCGFGTQFSKYQLKKLYQMPNLVIFMDGDNAGRKSRDYLVNRLSNKGDLYVMGGYLCDPDDMSIEKVQQLFENKKTNIEYRLMKNAQQ